MSSFFLQICLCKCWSSYRRPKAVFSGKDLFEKMQDDRRKNKERQRKTRMEYQTMGSGKEWLGTVLHGMCANCVRWKRLWSGSISGKEKRRAAWEESVCKANDAQVSERIVFSALSGDKREIQSSGRENEIMTWDWSGLPVLSESPPRMVMLFPHLGIEFPFGNL